MQLQRIWEKFEDIVLSDREPFVLAVFLERKGRMTVHGFSLMEIGPIV